MIDISVIVPIYNTEKYVEECILSILIQREVNLELILINNGSTDASLDIINSYAACDNRIKIINLNVNQGAASARNIGMSLARGKYLSFVDSDDWIAPETYKIMLERGTINNSDIIDCEMFYYFQDTDSYELSNNSENVLGMEGKKYFYLSTKKHSMRYEIATKIIKKDFVMSNELFFEEDIIYEDTLFVFKAYLLANSITHLANPLYFYRRHSNSTMHKTDFEHRYYSEYRVILGMQEFMRNRTYPIEILQEAINKINYERGCFKVLGEYDDIKNRCDTNKTYWEKLIENYNDCTTYKNVIVKKQQFEELRGCTHIYIYGTGYAALELMEQMEKNSIPIDGVLCDNKDDLYPKTFGGYSVIEYMKIVPKSEITVLIGYKKKYVDSIRRKLYDGGFVKILSFADE